MKLLKSLASLSLLLNIISCTTFRTSDWQAGVTLPASGDCYIFNVMSGKETRLPADQCEKKKARSIWIDSESYKLLRGDIQKNCLHSKCKQIVGAFDELFLTLDLALNKMPVP